MPTTELARTRDYNAWMDCSAGGAWLPEAIAQVTSWLREKHFDVDLTEWADYAHENASLRVRPLPPDRGHDLHVELTEQSPIGTWTTTVVLHDAPGDEEDWISLVVSNDEGKYVAVPRLAKYLMQVLPLGDGTLDFRDAPRVLGLADLDRLVAAVEDSGRHGLLFVAGTDPYTIPFDRFAKKVAQWSREVAGLAEVVILDPGATKAFEERVGTPFAVAPWTIRTFHPGADLANQLDARRHRFMTTGRLATHRDSDIARLLGDIARQQAATRVMDPGLLRVRRRLRRIETSRLVDVLAAPVPEPVAPLEVDAPEASITDPTDEFSVAQRAMNLVRSVFGLRDVTEEALRRIAALSERGETDRLALSTLSTKVEELQTSLDEAEDANAELSEALDDAQLETEISRIDIDDRDARIRWLESRLKEQGNYDVAWLDVPVEFQETRPRDFGEFLDRLDQLDTVAFTGDPTEVERLNQLDTNDSALRTAWDAVLTLCDYVKARGDGACDQGLEHYIAHTPAGYRSFPPGKFGATETGVTMRQFGEERLFSVPKEIDASGQAIMKAHFKLARIGMISPRMYVFDCHPDASRVIIGYIGPHLTNTQTR